MYTTTDPVVELEDIDAEIQQNDIYQQIVHDVTTMPKLQPLVSLLPKNGDINYLMNYLDIMTQFEVQLMMGRTDAEFKKIVETIHTDLVSYLDEQHKALQQYVQKMLMNAPEILHKKGSAFASTLITKNSWNKMGYTQLVDKKTPAGRKKSIKDQHWSCMDDCSLLSRLSFPLLSMDKIANFNVKGNNNNEVVLFHGTSGASKNSLLRSVDWKRGGGFLGQGFYLTFNPNEAKIYACRSANETRSNDAVVLEIVIKNANTLNQRLNWDNNNQHGAYVRNIRNDSGGWYDQLNIRDQGIRQMEIRRVHIIPRKALKHHGAEKDPNSGGKYTIQSKVGHFCK